MVRGRWNQMISRYRNLKGNYVCWSHSDNTDRLVSLSDNHQSDNVSNFVSLFGFGKQSERYVRCQTAPSPKRSIHLKKSKMYRVFVDFSIQETFLSNYELFTRLIRANNLSKTHETLKNLRESLLWMRWADRRVTIARTPGDIFYWFQWHPDRILLKNVGKIQFREILTHYFLISLFPTRVYAHKAKKDKNSK